MKFQTIIDPDRERDEVVIYAKERTRKLAELEGIIENFDEELLGYGEDGEIAPISLSAVTAFVIEGGRVFALVGKSRLRLKSRLYEIEKQLGADFIRINQSCIGNLRMIARFYASVGGALRVVFKNGYSDYVSRRQLKSIKERMNIKL